MIDTKALRQKILDMAIRGKLVPQDPNDESASVLLERIREEKQRLIKEGKIKKNKNDSVIFKGDDNRYYEKVGGEVKDITDDLPFEIPDSWSLVRLSSVCWLTDAPKITGEKLPYLDAKTLRGKVNTTLLFDGKVVNAGTKVILVDGENSGEVFEIPFRGYMGSTFKVLEIVSQFNTDYLNIVLEYYQKSLRENKTGSAIPHLNKKLFKSLLIGVPSLYEQLRITDRINELFKQIDIIEQNQADISTLYDEFRKRTLTLAIQGKLVPQDENDEPANVLLERIRAEKKAKLGKKYVDSYIYKGDDNCYYENIAGRVQDEQVEVPFNIPDNWTWVRWGNLSFSIQYGYNAPAKESGRIKMVRISDIHNNEVDWENVPFCNINESDVKTYLLKENDILFARTGGTVGKSYLVTSVPEEAIYAGYLIRTQYSNQLSAQYLKYFMESSLYWMQLKNGTVATAQPNCNGQTLSKMVLPLPPLAEQKRIVTKINEIFAML